MSPVDVTVVGSVNLDLVARVERLPRAGETLTAHGVTRLPGGKGANQALAAARLGARRPGRPAQVPLGAGHAQPPGRSR